jgi:hypothetical protein
MTHFLTPHQLAALEAVIAKARQAPGMHKEPVPNGEALACQFMDGINWYVISGNVCVARGTCPKEAQK